MVTRRLHLLLLTGIFTLLPLAATFAQSTGGIRGTVFNKDNEPVPGATVVILNAELGVQQGAVTDAKGEYRVAPLAPGKGYSVRVEFPGMGKVTIPDVEVTASRLTVVPVTLRPDKEMETKIRVVATTEVVNTESTTTQTTISSEYIDALPILGRNYQDVLTLAPGVTDVDGDGNPNIHGARDTDVATLVDGVSTVNPLTGMVGQQLNINSIQEIEVKTSGASAEFGRAQGGFVTIVTKSGGNDFEGSFRIDWRGNTLDGDGAGIDNSQLHGGLSQNGLRDLTFNDIYPQVTVSGPLKKDKAWYFVTAEYRQEETPVNALTQAFVQTHDETRLFAKATWQMSTNHKLVFTATFDPQKDYNLGVNSFVPVESGFTTEGGGRNLVLKETAVFSPNVFLDTTVQDFVSFPKLYGTTAPDTNGNGTLFFDRNHNGFIDATERDPGEDFDRDGVFDVFEDQDRDHILDTGEDKDHDSRLTQWSSSGLGGGCEGLGREDIDCDGRLDRIPETDSNGNGVLDPNEDLDHDGHFDSGTEDRNNNNILDDRPDPSVFNSEIKDASGVAGNYYPYAEAHPTPRDRDYEQDQRTLRTSGPYLSDFSGETGRQTLKQDLTIFVPDWHGQHELKTGYSLEREHYDQGTNLRPFMLPNLAPPASASFIPTIGAVLPAENQVGNTAKALAGALYVQDTYKPLPNLTLNLGLRFERETTDSFGYTQFDPAAERAAYDRLSGFVGTEFRLADDTVTGNNDGVLQNGICPDPLWGELAGGKPACSASQTDNAELYGIISTLKKASLSRLTQHHTSTTLVAANLEQLFPGAITQVCTNGVCENVIDRELLRAQGAVFQEEEAFRLTNNNLAPRIALSWDPWSDSKTKIFASWSRFYDKLFLNTIIPEEGPDTIGRYYRKDPDGITGSGIPDNGVGNAISKAPPSTAQVDRGLQTPFTDEWSIGFERELAPEVSIRISYIDRNGRLGLQDRDINHAVRYNTDGSYQDANGRITPVSNDGAGGPRVADNVPDLYNYNFFFNQVFRFGNYNTSQYKGIELELVKRLSRKWQMETSYTYSRAQGFAEDFNSNLGDDPASIPYTYGYLNFDQRHVIRLNGTMFLPGDWTAGGVLSWTSGLPYSVVTTVFDLDSFDYLQQRTLFGRITNDTSGGVFQGEHRNSRRNASILNINLQATKAFVMGRFNSKLFFTVENVLNRDNLQINTYEPDNPNRSGALQLNATRDFGRRFQIAFQFEF